MNGTEVGMRGSGTVHFHRTVPGAVARCASETRAQAKPIHASRRVGRAGSAVREGFPRRPEHERGGKREAQNRRRVAPRMNGDRTPALRTVEARRRPGGCGVRGGERRAGLPEAAAPSAGPTKASAATMAKSRERVAASAPMRAPDSEEQGGGRDQHREQGPRVPPADRGEHELPPAASAQGAAPTASDD